MWEGVIDETVLLCPAHGDLFMFGRGIARWFGVALGPCIWFFASALGCRCQIWLTKANDNCDMGARRYTSSVRLSTRPLFEFVQMLESGEHHLLARLLDLTGQKDFIKDGVDLNPERQI